MAKVIVYTIPVCPYCTRAKALLNERGVPFEEKQIDPMNDEVRDTLFQKSKMRTFPQIFADDQIIGGYDELSQKDQKEGGLDSLK